jgi:pyrimidine operon attenuation protein/uracil phosphoribosyltransferase
MAEIREKTQLMSASEIDRTLVRLAHEVLERAAIWSSWRWSAFAAGACRWPNV